MKEELACSIKDLGLIDYQEAWQLQQELVKEAIRYETNFVILCEHPKVLTIGRLADGSNLKVDEEAINGQGISLIKIDRGGDITLHAPGQLIVYPILHLSPLGKNLKSYLNKLEQVVIDLLMGFDIVATRLPGKTGVWLGSRKIASIGIGVRKWVSYHGIGININTDLSLFEMIRPCGLDVKMTSLAEIQKARIDMDDIKKRVISSLTRNLNLSIKD